MHHCKKIINLHVDLIEKSFVLKFYEKICRSKKYFSTIFYICILDKRLKSRKYLYWYNHNEIVPRIMLLFAVVKVLLTAIKWCPFCKEFLVPKNPFEICPEDHGQIFDKKSLKYSLLPSLEAIVNPFLKTRFKALKNEKNIIL